MVLIGFGLRTPSQNSIVVPASSSAISVLLPRFFSAENIRGPALNNVFCQASQHDKLIQCRIHGERVLMVPRSSDDISGGFSQVNS